MTSTASGAARPGTGKITRISRILVADDQQDVIRALRILLKGEGYEVESATSPDGILAAIDAEELDAVLMDLNYARGTTTGKEGLDLLPRIRAVDPTLPVVVMTAWGSVDAAVEAIRNGARDFIEKPWDNARLLATLRTQVELGQAIRRGQMLEDENRLLRREGDVTLIAESAAMQPVLRLMERVGPSDADVLILGDHGTGKEVVARCLHQASQRADQPLVTLNVGGLSEGVFESEMFGHIKGAFTDAKRDRIGRFELAHKGTLFLDEIANMPVSQQSKLLRVLQTGELERVGSSRTRHVDVRIISATNADLHAEAAAERFRPDLLFRLNTIEIHLPSLRDRREDIPLLAAHFLKNHTDRYRKNIKGFAPDAMRVLLDHPWPGNIRELDHAVERAVLMSQSHDLQPEDLGLRVEATEGGLRLEQFTLDEAERFLIQKALRRSDGNVSVAAHELGLSRSALYRRLTRHRL